MQKVLIETATGDVLVCAEDFDFTAYPLYDSETHTIKEHPTPLKCKEPHYESEYHRWNGTDYEVVQFTQQEKDDSRLERLGFSANDFKILDGLICLK